MLAYYLTGRSEYLQASYAPTDRARCKVCKDTIALHSLRIGEIMDDDHFSGQTWYHCECFTLKPRFKAIDPETQIYKLNSLDEEDIKCVLRQVYEGLKRFNGGKEIPKKYLKSKGKGKGKV